ncbi:MAG TPA: hypothetical protein VMY99_01965 [Nevskiaceae bacterium]|nr:hypothetical protein [Nevskiaceae bacterium]
MKYLRDKLLQKEMTRKEFLQHAGIAFALLLGFSDFISLLHSGKMPHPSRNPATTDSRHGFGSRKFGV